MNPWKCWKWFWCWTWRKHKPHPCCFTKEQMAVMDADESVMFNRKTPILNKLKERGKEHA